VTEGGTQRGTDRRATGRYLRFLALAAAAAALLAAVGWLPTRNLAGNGGTVALVAACVVCWLGSALGGVPVLLGETAAAATKAPVAAAFGSMLVRFVAVLGLAMAGALSGLVAVRPFLVWTGLGYLALLVVDTRYALAAGATGSDGTGSDGTGSDGTGSDGTNEDERSHDDGREGTTERS